jgi:hypothetical protein
MKGSMSGDARDFNIETRAAIKSPPPLPQGKAPKEIHVILKGTLGEHAPSYATVKNWVDQFKRGDFFGAIQMISCWAQLVTMDETWLYHYDPEAKQQSMECAA